MIGFVWQQSAKNLLPYLTAAENVELPMLLEGVAPGDRQARATQLLELVGLGERGDHRPDRLSGGEQQRVSIAVAIANRPAVLFADEPTGELDFDTAQQIFDLLRSVNAELARSWSSPTTRWSASASAGPSPSATAAPPPRRASRRGVGGRGASPGGGGVRGARPRRPPAAAARLRRRPRPAAPGAAGAGGRPHHGLARS